jgi:hypothetical protein
MSSKFCAELSSDYKKHFETETGYDVVIYAKQNKARKKFMHIQIFYVLDLNIFVLFSLMNGLKKKDEKFTKYYPAVI